VLWIFSGASGGRGSLRVSRSPRNGGGDGLDCEGDSGMAEAGAVGVCGGVWVSQPREAIAGCDGGSVFGRSLGCVQWRV